MTSAIVHGTEYGTLTRMHARGEVRGRLLLQSDWNRQRPQHIGQSAQQNTDFCSRYDTVQAVFAPWIKVAASPPRPEIRRYSADAFGVDRHRIRSPSRLIVGPRIRKLHGLIAIIAHWFSKRKKSNDIQNHIKLITSRSWRRRHTNGIHTTYQECAITKIMMEWGIIKMINWWTEPSIS